MPGRLFHGRNALLFILSVISINTYASPEVVPGQYVVTLHSPVKNSAMALNLLGQGENKIVQKVRDTIFVVQRDPTEPQLAAMANLQVRAGVELIEPNYIYHANRTPNDPEYINLWGLHNTGQMDLDKTMGVAGVDINAEKAWDITTGSKKVVIAIIDTGVDFKIPDLKDNAWTNEAEANGIPQVDDDKNGYIDDIHGYNFVAGNGDSTDDNEHGSHCAGTIGGKGNDGTGVAGVNWDVSIMAVKFLSSDGSGTLANAIAAIDYARKNGARIMSNSWGGGSYTETLKKAITDARDAGALFVAAAGNDGTDNDTTPAYPASYDVDNIISVAAVDIAGQPASFTNVGAKSVHVAAPGVNIRSTIPGGFAYLSGTSMATPHVSGVAGLLLANNDQLTYKEVRERIIKSAHPLASLKGVIASGGIVDAYAALLNQVPPPDPNDPNNWVSSLPDSTSSPHPYTSKFSQTYKVTAPGAKRVAVHFAKFDTEKNFDVVEFFDAQGKSLGKMSGKHDDTFSPVVNGDTMTMTFISDASVNSYGFAVDRIAYE
jgi:thermitase